MKFSLNIYFSLLLFPSFLLNADAKIVNIEKKKIVIFTSKGGGAHKSASKAITDYLKDDYEIISVNPFEDIFESLDPINKITFNTWKGEDLYNFFLKNRWNRMINLLGDFGEYYTRTHQRRMIKCLKKYIQNEKPDMIISVVPYTNSATFAVAKEHNVPFLIIPADMDATTYILDIDAKGFEKFALSLPFDDSLLLEKIDDELVPEDKIKFLGFPLRSTFFEKKDKQKIKKEFAIDKDKKVIMILMGATGSSAIHSYVKKISKSKLNLHLIVCIGREESLIEQLRKIKLPKNITTSEIGFTDKAADLMAISDLLITKSGPTSLCEAIQMNLPVLIDNTSISLKWEKISSDFVRKHDLGKVITNFNQVNKFLEKLFKNEDEIKTIKKRMNEFKTKNFKLKLKNLVKEMIN